MDEVNHVNMVVPFVVLCCASLFIYLSIFIHNDDVIKRLIDAKG